MTKQGEIKIQKYELVFINYHIHFKQIYLTILFKIKIRYFVNI